MTVKGDIRDLWEAENELAQNPITVQTSIDDQTARQVYDNTQKMIEIEAKREAIQEIQ